MSDTRVLLIEDESRWQDILKDALIRAFGKDTFCLVEDYPAARKQIQSETFDLISIDLALPDIPDLATADLPGMALLKDIRNNPRNANAGLLILSARTTVQRVREALRDYDVFDFLDKLDYTEDAYIDKARCAVRKALLERAENLQEQSYKFAITYNNDRFLRGELTGPATYNGYLADDNSSVPFDDFARRADDLNTLLINGDVEWRGEARKLGDGLYAALIRNSELLQGLTTALTLTNKRPANLTLEFIGPVDGLSCPFELLRCNDYFAMAHSILRRTERQSKIGLAEPFVRFVKSLLRNRDTMRILVVGSSYGGKLPAAEEEARQLAKFFEVTLEQLEIPHHVTQLIGPSATRRRLTDVLKSGYHLFHYAGHADYDEKLPEGSPLMLADGIFTAADLKTALREVDLRFAFLSCCLGARTASQVGRGDFHGFLHALLQSGVPTAIGYRWEVHDNSAFHLAADFYRELFRSFCPGRALLHARQNRSMASEQKRDDPTWASPVLVMEV